jgi:uncharacterized protein
MVLSVATPWIHALRRLGSCHQSIDRCVYQRASLHGSISPAVWYRQRLFTTTLNAPMSPQPMDDNNDDNDMAHELQQANNRYQGRLEIRATESHGWGLWALRIFVPGDIVMRAHSLTTTTVQGRHSVQMDWQTHVHWDLPARFVNHTCGNANVGLRVQENGRIEWFDFVALREINVGEQILWDYETTEYEIHDFVCSCGSAHCRKVLRGFRYHGDQVMAAYGADFIAPYLLRSSLGTNGVNEK